MSAGTSASDKAEAAEKARIAQQIAEAEAQVLARWGDIPATRAKIEAIKSRFVAEPDMARRWLIAYAVADTMEERLRRSIGLPGRGPFVDKMQSDDEWDERAEWSAARRSAGQ